MPISRRVLQKYHAVFVLENFATHPVVDEILCPPEFMKLPEQALLDLFCDETQRLALRYKAVNVLGQKKSVVHGPALLEFLNSIVHADPDPELDPETQGLLIDFAYSLGHVATPEAYEGLKKFLNHLLTADPEHQSLFVEGAAFSLATVSLKLNMRDSIPMLKSAIACFEDLQNGALEEMARHFYALDEPSGIKHILTEYVTCEMPDVENECLELLEELEPDFVEKWRTQKATANTENEESS